MLQKQQQGNVLILENYILSIKQVAPDPSLREGEGEKNIQKRSAISKLTQNIEGGYKVSKKVNQK